MKKYTVSWKVRGEPVGFQSGVLDESQKEELISSLENDDAVFDIEVEEIE